MMSCECWLEVQDLEVDVLGLYSSVVVLTILQPRLLLCQNRLLKFKGRRANIAEARVPSTVESRRCVWAYSTVSCYHCNHYRGCRTRLCTAVSTPPYFRSHPCSLATKLIV